jgi:hypothetical protein
MGEDEFQWQPDAQWVVPIEHDDGEPSQRCVEMVLRSIEARRGAEQADQRVRPPATYYTSEFYFLTAARFFAMAARDA